MGGGFGVREARFEPGRGLKWTALICSGVALAVLLFDSWSFLNGHMSRGQVVGRDFANYWSGSRLLFSGHVREIFVQDDYMRAMHGLWGKGFALHSFSYPPSIFPFIAWTAALPYGPALALWLGLGAAALLAAGWPYTRDPKIALLLLLSPAVLACIDIGQNGFLTSALIVGGLRLVDRRPWIAGVLIGLATFKPHLGLLIPVALAASGRWRVIGGAAAAAAGLFAVSILMAGPEAWMLYLTKTVAYQRVMLEDSSGIWEMMTPSAFIAGRLMGLPQWLGWALQAVVSTACLALVFRHFRKLGREGRRFEALDVLLLVAAGFTASPYSFNYDMPGLALAVLIVALTRKDLEALREWRLAQAALWSAPVAMVLMSFGPDPFLPTGALLCAGGLWLVAKIASDRVAMPMVAAVQAQEQGLAAYALTRGGWSPHPPAALRRGPSFPFQGKD